MPDSLLTELLNFGALGLFAAFLVWQHLSMQKRLDALVGGFQAQLKEIELGYDKRIEVMRQRYDVVIEGHSERAREEKAALDRQKEELQKQLLETLSG
jgi:hypothetical protein